MPHLRCDSELAAAAAMIREKCIFVLCPILSYIPPERTEAIMFCHFFISPGKHIGWMITFLTNMCVQTACLPGKEDRVAVAGGTTFLRSH